MRRIAVALLIGACGGSSNGGRPDATPGSDGSVTVDAPSQPPIDARARPDARIADGPLASSSDAASADGAAADGAVADGPPVTRADASADDAGPPTSIIQVSVDSSGAEGASDSPYGVALSADGRYTFFMSANALAGGPTPIAYIGYLHDRATGETTLAVTPPGGGQPNGHMQGPYMTPDGRYLAFESWATNLVAGDTDTGHISCFIADRQLGTIAHIDLTPSGAVGDSDCTITGISDDGTKVLFQSDATDLVPNDTNASLDVFVRDVAAGTTTRISLDFTGAELPFPSGAGPLSADGRYAVFETFGDGVVPTDNNGRSDAFVVDLVAGGVTLATVPSAGLLGDGDSFPDSLTPDGRYLVFDSDATNLVAGDTNGADDTFVRDLVAGTTTRVSVANDGSQAPSGGAGGEITPDGRYVIFVSFDDSLVAGDTNGLADIYLRDRIAGATLEYTKAGAGGTCANLCGGGQFSRDGLSRAFISSRPLVGGDTNGLSDAFEGPALP
jgi:Tol biopolymer transport system component